VITQEPKDGSEPPQPFVWEKDEIFTPVMVIPEIVNGAPPVFVSRVVSWFVCSCGTDPKSRLVGLNEIAADVPVPLNGTVCGEPGASSVKLILPLLAPVACGVNVTPTSQKDAGERCAPQVLEEIRKSAVFVPVIRTEDMFKVALPVLVRRVESGAVVVETATDPKLRLVGEKLVAACVPLPDRATD
jgi:hypothetical protein